MISPVSLLLHYSVWTAEGTVILPKETDSFTQRPALLCNWLVGFDGLVLFCYVMLAYRDSDVHVLRCLSPCKTLTSSLILELLSTARVTLGSSVRWSRPLAHRASCYAAAPPPVASPHKPEDTAAETARQCVYQLQNYSSLSTASALLMVAWFYKPNTRKIVHSPMAASNVQLKDSSFYFTKEGKQNCIQIKNDHILFKGYCSNKLKYCYKYRSVDYILQ